MCQSYDNLLVCGDLNVDFMRGGHNCRHLQNFMREYNLVSVDTNSSVKYTYRRDDHTSFSWPDHILTLSHTAHLITDIACTESVDNFSDHLPLSFSLTYNHPIIVNANATSYSNQINMDSSHTVKWDKVTEDDSINYCEYVRNHLPDISEELVSCCNPNCSTHTTDLNAVCLQLLSCLEEGAIQCLPMIQSRRPAVPGWNIHARSLQKTAKFWHKLWSECGCPSSGIMFQLKKNSKSRYKYEVRRLKRQQQYIKSEMMQGHCTCH